MTKKQMLKKRCSNTILTRNLLSVACVIVAILTASCGNDDNDAPTVITHNPAAYIKDDGKLAMLHAMRDVDGTGRLYEIDYTADYRLDDVLKAGYTQTDQLFSYIAYLLYDSIPKSQAKVSLGTGCSAFAAPERQSGNFMMGRNYDYRHSTADGKSYKSIAAILVHTAPAGGKRSISMVDGMNLGYGKGFYTDGTTDLSLLMGLPYAALDGINEDGFAIGVLSLNENQTNQQTGKPRIGTTTAIRMLLDKASTVNEAIQLLGSYDMDMRGSGRGNYHYFMADATGDYAIVEYTRSKGETTPRVMEVLKGNDTLRCVTNFYVSPTMVGTTDGWGSKHGKVRYDTLRNTLRANNYVLKAADAMPLLQAVSQPPTEELTSQTQWSALYGLSEKTLRLSILREYGKTFNFKIK
ncbi:carcinine hydrolase/isopenicillin-N N-acyltransferase family protein [Segatella copri]|uniref:carcinine hydrolase/isopenicillin-N N-acyltransferase family protein n=1 Tax=Segatella copri TaxID=165179 RepID=UPI003F88F3FF